MSSGHFISHGLTHVGLVRRRNEDAFLDCPELGLWAVADGMGGHEAGDYASARIVAALGAIEMPAELGRFIRAAADRLVDVDAELRARASELGPGTVIASTVVVLLAAGEEFAVLWAGDSRAYRWRNGEFCRLSVDHSHVQELVTAGLLPAEDAALHPQSHIVTQAIGAGRLEFGIVREALVAGDRFLLCSDGLTNMLRDADIARAVAAAGPREAAERLLDQVLGRGAIDNVTLVIIASPSRPRRSSCAGGRDPVRNKAPPVGVCTAAPSVRFPPTRARGRSGG